MHALLIPDARESKPRERERERAVRRKPDSERSRIAREAGVCAAKLDGMPVHAIETGRDTRSGGE
eukprot:3449363-Pleurochrysis_carterae.AAC.4